jgi:hypothetical protein
MPMQVLNGPTIQAGESLSDAVDCSGGSLVRITMPPAWDQAPLTFEFSTDGVFFNDMFDLKGFAVTVEHVVEGSGVIIPSDIGRAIAFLKFRSGSRGNPVEQSETRNFAVTIVPFASEPAAPARSAKKKVAKKAAKKSRR